MEATQIKKHIEILKRLLAAQICTDKARASNSKLIPRRGIRGGRATTLSARHDLAARELWEIEQLARDSANELWYTDSVSWIILSCNCTHEFNDDPDLNPDLNQCGFGGAKDHDFLCKYENCKLIKSVAQSV